jgi:hypothetical protein
MKYLILVAESLMLLCFATILSREPTYRPDPLTAAQRSAEIQKLHTELDKTSAKLSTLEGEGHTFRPR